jgi:hypothetical protein
MAALCEPRNVGDIQVDPSRGAFTEVGRGTPLEVDPDDGGVGLMGTLQVLVIPLIPDARMGPDRDAAGRQTGGASGVHAHVLRRILNHL